jgi:hypothetical protein
MDWLLNSGFVNYLLKLAFSKSGVVARHVATALVGAVVAKVGSDTISAGDQATIGNAITSGITAVFSLGWVGLQYWLNLRSAKAQAVVQTMLNQSPVSSGKPILKVDGVIGNNTILAAQAVTGVNAQPIIAKIAGPPIRDQLD